MKKIIFVLALSLLIGTVAVGNCQASQETSVDVTFELVTGSGRSDYYVGDYFWYNISLFNSGSAVINATFKVEILNVTGGIVEAVREYPLTLKLNETVFLYPNYTRFGKEEYNVYFFETPETHSIVLSSETPLTYYVYNANGRYTVTTFECRFVFDVMPSYERVQNDRWSEFLDKNEDYMNQVQRYIQESQIQAQKTIVLTYFTIIVALSSVFLAIGSFYVSWWQLRKEKQKENRWFFRVFVGVFLVILLLIGYEFWVILS